MKKLLVGTAVIALGFAVAAPAQAQVKLDLGGHFKGYGAWVDQDEFPDDPATAGIDESLEARSFDILRETEIHFTGETTLDNGLTVGFHAEADIDAADAFNTEEAYAYFSGAWGRVNFGKEDGAGYLLQVAAPSADSNIDGIRQYVQPVNYTVMGVDVVNGSINIGDLVFDVDGNGVISANDIVAGADFNLADVVSFDYDMAVTGTDNKFTYLTPVFNGFQAGFSYTPDTGQDSRGINGVNADDEAGDYGNVWEVGARYEGQFGELGLALGAGYIHASLERDSALFFQDTNGNGAQDAAEPAVGALDDREAWNVGLDLNWGPFGIGAIYTEDDLGFDGNADREIWVVGIDYTTGPFKLGASYYNQDQEIFGIADVETDRYTGGVTYTYGPGMSFRGSISYIDHGSDAEATSVLLGTQIDF